MPHATLDTPTGTISCHYNILTPTSPSAEKIDPNIPTILFFHGIYMAQEIFEPQASDPTLRQFNLVLVDLRVHGYTTGRTGSPYTPTQTADDVYRLMKHLNLPPCHVFGLSIGSCAAIELAIQHPNMVLSLTLCSPLPPEEPEMALSGREELYTYYTDGIKDAPDTIITDLIDDAVFGVLQMVFNNVSSPRIDALKDVTLVHVLRNWGWEPEKVDDGYAVVSIWFSSRRRLTLDDLAKIRCPVQLIHGRDDLPYPEHFARETETDMRNAGVDVTWHGIDGPHFFCFTNYEPVNQLLHDIVVATDYRPGAHIPSSAPLPLMTPFHDALAERGYYNGGDDDDSGSDDFDFA